MEPGSHIGNACVSHFSRSEMVAFASIFDLCLLFEFLS
jgi:hypothetical protein